MDQATFIAEMERLVEAFRKNRAYFLSANYDESSLRNDFLTPFWRALGWDVRNREGLTQQLREVQVETRVDVAGAKKRADYLFRTDGIDRFVCEAKKPSADLKKHSFQTQRYAFNLGLLVATLANFDELQVFIVGGKPDVKVPWAVYKTWKFTEYIEKADEIWNLFSRQAVASGSLDRWVASLPKKEVKGKARQGWLIPVERIRTVDSEFLAFFESQREHLAKLLVKFNRTIKWESGSLSECIQRILDRILFVRICEDRDIDTGRSLSALVGDWDENRDNNNPLYRTLVAHFNRLDASFNGQLFRAGHLSEKLFVPNTFLVDLIRDLSKDDSDYLFNTIPVEILGTVYEQFIGKTVEVSPRGVVKIEDKPAVRNAGGVFYTPKYVVDFTVDRTLNGILKDQTLKGLSQLRIIDPSCGSGSFLIRIFERICLAYLQCFAARPKEQKPDLCYKDADGTLRLTSHLKRQILIDNIFGVDIDSQAVEVTMLSLYLKILEDETKSTLGKQRLLFPRETFLPDLQNNIKCGNSLIGGNYDSSEIEDTLETASFDWITEFPFLASTPFNAVIGNPPWGATLSVPHRKYLATEYSRVVARMPDTYIYFIDKASLLAGTNGVVGFVVPSTLLNQVDAEPARKLLLERGLSTVASLGQGIFGLKVLNTSTVFVSEKRGASDPVYVVDVANVPLSDRKNKLIEGTIQPWKAWKANVASDPHASFLLSSEAASALLGRLRKKHGTLVDVLEGKIQRGVSPDNVEAHVMSPSIAKDLGLEAAALRTSLSGTQIKRYQPFSSDQVIIWTHKENPIAAAPNVRKHLAKFRGKNTCKEVSQGKHPWWSLHRPRKAAIFASPKIIGLTTAKTIQLVFDETENLHVTDAMYVFRPKTGLDPLGVMAVMQSKTFLYLYRLANQGESRVIPQIKAAKLHTLPFPSAGSITESKVASKAKRLTALNKALAESVSERTSIIYRREIAKLEDEIEVAVSALYGMTEVEYEFILASDVETPNIEPVPTV